MAEEYALYIRFFPNDDQFVWEGSFTMRGEAGNHPEAQKAGEGNFVVMPVTGGIVQCQFILNAEDVASIQGG